ncbi:MAG: ABC transporter substrate-binding protein [Candidatus Kerfeldbacteria bacterium]|nr:ABC transporter substrate-binding protein [Candidatus Kerfeldbacteria bacterium]
MSKFPRIVSLAPAATEIVCALGAADGLVGVTELCDWPSGIGRGRTTVGGWTDPELESVAALRPDLVVTSTFVQRSITVSLRKLGLNVLHLDVQSLADVRASFVQLANAIGRPAAGKKLSDSFTQALGHVTASTGRPIHVYVEEWMHPPSVSGNWVPEMLRLAGGRGLATNSAPSYPVTLGDVRAFNPDLMVVSWCNTKGKPNLNAVYARPGWAALPVIQARRVHAIDDSLLNRPGPRLSLGLAVLQQVIEQYRRLEGSAVAVLESSA